MMYRRTGLKQTAPHWELASATYAVMQIIFLKFKSLQRKKSMCPVTAAVSPVAETDCSHWKQKHAAAFLQKAPHLKMKL